MRRFLAIAVIVIFGGLIWWFFVSPAMVPATVSISGFDGMDDATVRRYAGIGNRATFVSVNAREAQSMLERHPLVESASVVKTFPDRVSIRIVPRVAVATGLVRVDGRMRPLYFDRHGVGFRIGSGADGPAAASMLPLVSGLDWGDARLSVGARLPEPVLPLFERIGAITDEEPNIWRAISQIAVEWNDNETFDLVLYPTGDFVRLRMGSDISWERIRYALLMLDVVRRMGSSAPGEIDVRSGIGVLGAGGGGL